MRRTLDKYDAMDGVLIRYGGGNMAVNSSAFMIKSLVIETDSSKVVDYVDIVLEMSDYDGTAYITDVMFQGGGVPTSWVGHVSEIRWSFDNA